jgi:hypothetical protein
MYAAVYGAEKTKQVLWMEPTRVSLVHDDGNRLAPLRVRLEQRVFDAAISDGIDILASVPWTGTEAVDATTLKYQTGTYASGYVLDEDSLRGYQGPRWIVANGEIVGYDGAYSGAGATLRLPVPVGGVTYTLKNATGVLRAYDWHGKVLAASGDDRSEPFESVTEEPTLSTVDLDLRKIGRAFPVACLEIEVESSTGRPELWADASPFSDGVRYGEQIPDGQDLAGSDPAWVISAGSYSAVDLTRFKTGAGLQISGTNPAAGGFYTIVSARYDMSDDVTIISVEEDTTIYGSLGGQIAGITEEEVGGGNQLDNWSYPIEFVRDVSDPGGETEIEIDGDQRYVGNGPWSVDTVGTASLTEVGETTITYKGTNYSGTEVRFNDPHGALWVDRDGDKLRLNVR